jgi:selenide, water dikinase
MQPVTELHRDLVLVGGGHSHALALRMLAMKPIAGLRITLVSLDTHTPYSGMLPGLVAGNYTFEEAHIDLARLCQWAGARFIAAEVIGIDTITRRLSLSGRPPLCYDIVSIDVGSQPELDSVPGAAQFATPVKPVSGLWRHWQALRERIDGSGVAHRVAVVGGGAGSVELVLAMAHSMRGQSTVFDLWCGTAKILPDYNTRARRSVMAALQRCAVNVHLDARVAAVEQGVLVLGNGQRAGYDDLFWCTGAAAPAWIAGSGMATDSYGFLAVRDTLQAQRDERVFGAGDVATQENYPRPKSGVFAVRQAPVLARNLRARLLHKKLRAHRPQQHFLSLISLGDRHATANKWMFSATGAWVWRWKNRIDRKFMAKFEKLPAGMPRAPKFRLPSLASVPQQASCGGCGAKVDADALSGALAQLSRDYPRHCVGAGDDAVVVPAPAGAAVVQSLDLLRQLVSDPWQMGRIAANHALSDLYACGARPVSALAAITLPFSSGTLQQRELEQLLDGALHEFALAGCRLNGGHSLQGAELCIGFAVNGVAMSPDGRLLGKVGATPGDQLVLTKPLGTGALFAAHMQLAADGREISAAVASMLQSNRAAAELALAHGASACTDVTGFGLLGHLLEMLAGSHSAKLELARLPLLRGALEHLNAGVSSTMQEANTRSAGWSVQNPDTIDQARMQMLFDPQTSGGLLIAIAAERSAALCQDLQQRGYGQARVIGEVTALAPGSALSVQLR